MQRNELPPPERSRRVPHRLWFYASVLVGLGAYAFWCTGMPGISHQGPTAELTPAQRALEARLREHVMLLAGEIGERNVASPERLTRARDYLRRRFESFTGGKKDRVTLEPLGASGSHADNVIYELPGDPQSIIVVGAHYDSAEGTPGANDNASGTAAALELARHFSTAPPRCTLRFVLFANEEPPFFKNEGMGSLTNARNAQRRGDPIRAMLALETLGAYSDVPGSQKYPWPVGLLYPDRGNFVAFVGNIGSRSLVRQSISAFREHAAFPSEGAALPATFPGVDWSDHWAFWQTGYPALMVTDTAVYRDPNYHHASDTPEHLSYDKLALVVDGLKAVIADLAR